MILHARSTVKRLTRRALTLMLSRAIASSMRQWDWIRHTQNGLLPGVRNTNKPSILFEVDDVRATYAELKEKGVLFLSEPYEINTGLAAEFEDPFGNRLGITDYT